MNAREYLKRLEKIDKIIENKIIEKKQWQDIATGMTAKMDGERVQSSGSKDKIGDAIAKIMEIESEIVKRIDELVDTKIEVISMIEKLPKRMYDFLHMAYIQGFKFGQIASMKGKSYSWATTEHDKALKALQDVLDKEYGDDEYN